MGIDDKLSRVFNDPDTAYRFYASVRKDVMRELIATDMAITRIAQDLLEVFLYTEGDRHLLALLLMLAHPLEYSYADIARESGYHGKRDVMRALKSMGRKYQWVALLMEQRAEQLKAMSVGAGGHRIVRKYEE